MIGSFNINIINFNLIQMLGALEPEKKKINLK